MVDVFGRITARLRRDTPTTSPRATEDAIAGVVEELLGAHPVAAVGIGAAGFVDAERARVLFSPHLAWRNEPLREAVQRRVGLPVVVDNDANATAWAEWRFGAGRGERNLVCLTLGTGIGGALMLGGRLVRGEFGLAGEFGHMTAVPGGRRCGCGNRGCWEEYASGNALVREARELAGSGSPVAQDLLARVGGDVSEITGPVVMAAARAGDPAAVELYDEVGRWLGHGMASIAAALDPGCFVVGGGVAEAGDLLLEPARQAYRHALSGRGYRPTARIVGASLGGEAGLIGAGDLAREAIRPFRPRGPTPVAGRRRLPGRAG